MKNKTLDTRIYWIVVVLIFSAGSFYFGFQKRNQLSGTENNCTISVTGQRLIIEGGKKWNRCLLAPDETLYFSDNIKSTDGGKTFVAHKDIDINPLIAQPERAILSSKDIVYALDGPTKIESPGVYSVVCWKSDDNLKTIQEGKATINIPNGPEKQFENDQWNGLFVYRTILQMPDGSWLATMYGNFNTDTIVPHEDDAKQELKFMMNTFVVKSIDKGHTWNYLSTIAVPRSGDPVGEGFVEPAITILNDGRLLCIMRAGHHFPLYSSWSSDGGLTWTAPLYSGLDRGCDPCMITLRDGRVALSWGRRFPEGWSQVTSEGDKGRFVYPGEGYTSLSISDDGGITWETSRIDENTGSCYSTIFEIEPNVLFCQVDSWSWRISLKPQTDRK